MRLDCREAAACPSLLEVAPHIASHLRRPTHICSPGGNRHRLVSERLHRTTKGAGLSFVRISFARPICPAFFYREFDRRDVVTGQQRAITAGFHQQNNGAASRDRGPNPVDSEQPGRNSLHCRPVASAFSDMYSDPISREHLFPFAIVSLVAPCARAASSAARSDENVARCCRAFMQNHVEGLSSAA
jgi:hypothetical protein